MGGGDGVIEYTSTSTHVFYDGTLPSKQFLRTDDMTGGLLNNHPIVVVNMNFGIVFENFATFCSTMRFEEGFYEGNFHYANYSERVF